MVCRYVYSPLHRSRQGQSVTKSETPVQIIKMSSIQYSQIRTTETSPGGVHFQKKIASILSIHIISAVGFLNNELHKVL